MQGLMYGSHFWGGGWLGAGTHMAAGSRVVCLSMYLSLYLSLSLSLSLYIYICITCAHVYIYICIYIHVTYIYTYIIYMCMLALWNHMRYIYIYIHIYIYIYMCDVWGAGAGGWGVLFLPLNELLSECPEGFRKPREACRIYMLVLSDFAVPFYGQNASGGSLFSAR